MLLNLPAKCDSGFKALAISKKKFFRQIFNWICWEYDRRRTTKDGAASFLLYIFRTSACSRMHNSRRLFRFCRYWFCDASRCIAPVCVFFRLASSLFRQLASPSAFSCFSVFLYFPSISPLSLPFSLTRAFSQLAAFPRQDETGYREGSQRKRRREMKFKEVSIKWPANPSFRHWKHGLIISRTRSTRMPWLYKLVCTL